MTIAVGASAGWIAAPRESKQAQADLRTRVDAPTEVRPARTKLSLPQATEGLRAAWAQVFGEPPPPRAVALLAAQWAHETGQGASMFNYNFGGIKGVGPSGLSVSQRTKEGWGATERTIVDRFRAYGSAEEGAVDYVKLLAKRFPGAIDAARRGDATGFVRQLKARGYFTGDEQVYARSVTRLASQALEALGGGGTDLSDLPRLSAARVAESTFARAEFEPLPSNNTPGALTAVGLMSISDELTRAALSISAAELRRQDRSG